MKRYRRWAAALLAAAITAAASLPLSLAAPAPTPFAEFRIDAAGMDFPEHTISVDIYRRDDSGLFQVDNRLEYTCRLNRATRDAGFFIQAQADGVWVTVDYLTDVNNDGVYELLEDTDAPVWDVMDLHGALLTDTVGPALEQGQTYILSPDQLIARSRCAVQDRAAGGPCALEAAREGAAQQEFPLCMIKLHRTDPADAVSYEQTYYLQIYDDILLPLDVSPADWYFDAVEFVLSKGYFSGTTEGLFLPAGQLPRAQLAQVLWSMAGRPEATGAHFSDVSPEDWYYQAVSWCQQERLIAGYTADIFAPADLLSREQMYSILYRYARYTGAPAATGADLSRFADMDQVSSWAVESIQWASANGLLSGDANLLQPQTTVCRAELAVALYYYALNAGLNR